MLLLGGKHRIRPDAQILEKAYLGQLPVKIVLLCAHTPPPPLSPTLVIPTHNDCSLQYL